jgi:hypothetical protein
VENGAAKLAEEVHSESLFLEDAPQVTENQTSEMQSGFFVVCVPDPERRTVADSMEHSASSRSHPGESLLEGGAQVAR